MRRWLLPLAVGGVLVAVAYQATLTATPFALMYVASQRVAQTGATNIFVHRDVVRAEAQPIVRPSPDLLYSTCVFDVSDGPVLIDVAAVPDHYWSISIFDARTDVAAVRSDRDTGGKAARLALYREGQKIPAGYEPVKLAYAKGVALIRILLTDSSEFAKVDTIRRQSRCNAI